MGTTADKLQKILDSKNAIKLAIEAKGVQDVGDILAEYPQKIESIQTGGGTGYTGHVDVEGLKAIGWTDEDIEYFQQHGVDWNEEEDEYYKVPQDNIDLYGKITTDNIADYKDILVYLPKIDTSGMDNMDNLFESCNRLIAIPYLDTSNVTGMNGTFRNCSSLTCVPFLNLSKVRTISNLFNGCSRIKTIPPFDTSSVEYFALTFLACTSLEYLPNLDFSSSQAFEQFCSNCYSLKSVPAITSDYITAVSLNNIFTNCYNLRSIPLVDIKNLGVVTGFSSNFNLRDLFFKNLSKSLLLSQSPLLSKESLLYIIENAAPTSAIKITLHASCYNKYSADSDITAALAAQPLVSLASA